MECAYHSEDRVEDRMEDAALGRAGTASRHSCIHSLVTGDGHQDIGPQESAVQPSAIGFRTPRLIPERLAPELQAPAPVTCHPEWV